jgi:hypothetical protein
VSEWTQAPVAIRTDPQLIALGNRIADALEHIDADLNRIAYALDLIEQRDKGKR